LVTRIPLRTIRSSAQREPICRRLAALDLNTRIANTQRTLLGYVESRAPTAQDWIFACLQPV